MAIGAPTNPQIENGHTDIANEIMEALAKIRISGEARQVLDLILRKTYGWHKKWDRISLSQFTLGTGLKKSTVCKALNKLLFMNLVITKKDNAGISNYMFNKYYDTWKPLPKKITLPKPLPKKIIPITKKGNVITQKGNESLPKKRHTKENIQKKLLQKKTITKETNIDVKIFIDYFYDKFLEKTGEKYHVDGGKDGMLIKSLLGTHSLDELKILCDKFFDSMDDFILKAGYSIGIFKSVINKLKSVRIMPMTGTGLKTHLAGQEFIRKQKEQDKKKEK